MGALIVSAAIGITSGALAALLAAVAIEKAGKFMDDRKEEKEDRQK